MFKNRLEAGEILAKRVVDSNLYCDYLLACVRGGVEVAYPIAKAMKKEIFPLLVHKIPSAINEEFAVGGVSIDGNYILNEYGEKEDRGYLEKAIKETVDLLKEREKSYGVKFDSNAIVDKVVFLVDDGIATGETLYVGVKTVLAYKPKDVYVLVPVSSYEGFLKISSITKVISLYVDRYFYALSQYFEDFPQVSDDSVKNYLMLSKEF